MKRFAFVLLLVVIAGFAFPCFAEDKTYRIEVLQVTNIEPYQKSYEGFLKILEDNGIVQGKNLTINRTVIDYDLDKGGLWKKMGVLLQIRSQASRIVSVKPDLVLTIGTPATKYAKDKIISAGIPLVFTAVAIPEAAGCASLTEAGHGFTGATLYMNMQSALHQIKLAFPAIRTIGIVHSDDENAVANVEDAKKYAASYGLTFISQEVGKSDNITKALEDLSAKGAQAFCVPLDTYYGLRNYEAARALEMFSNRTRLPVISFALMKVPGAMLYVGSDFETIGELSAQQAVKILKEGATPESLPILMQKEPKVMADKNRLAEFRYTLPSEIIGGAQAVDFTRQKTYRIEVLQVTDIDPFQKAYEGFIQELKDNGLVEGKNLIINRKVIDFDMDSAGLWSKVGVLMRIRDEAKRIAELKPDLALTIGTPATKYGKGTIIDAGIPVVFTAVAIPEAAGCRSKTVSGHGFTGSTLYMNMHNALKIVRIAFPNIKRVGIIYSDDENGIAHTEEASLFGPQDAGLTFISKQVSKNDSIIPAAQELAKQGVEAFAVPLDTYYGLRKYEAAKDMNNFSLKTKIPIFSFALVKIPGAMMYVGSDFGVIGRLSGGQALKIIKDGVHPENLPVLKQENLRILVDTNQLRELHYKLPLEILQIAEEVE
ncbi:MAG TPA: ABC transporter substrate binding protein [Desulfomonilia bacterium]|nr:ABC transporter substrate binding protein [Desulfomonilia bacterium]